MSDLSGQAGEMRCTLTVTRKATGKVETFDVVGKVIPEQPEEQDGSHPLDGGEKRGD